MSGFIYFISEKIFIYKTLYGATGAEQRKFSAENFRVLDVIIFEDNYLFLFLKKCTNLKNSIM